MGRKVRGALISDFGFRIWDFNWQILDADRLMQKILLRSLIGDI
jgi:hypothetical protein